MGCTQSSHSVQNNLPIENAPTNFVGNNEESQKNLIQQPTIQKYTKH
jgi:hypothetical protein